MLTRRDFLQTASALASSSLVWSFVPDSIAKAAAIDPDMGTTFHDAEHVVILMQENRSFDHAFGALRGVRGFRDPRVHRLPSGAPAWFQPDGAGKTIPPFRLDMDGSNITWIGGTPHSWPDQVDARNSGLYDNWIKAKARNDGFPMTMGFFTREDIPFYYALADAFSVFDQAFCSSLTGTTPNRLFLWSGTIREDAAHPARVMNEDTGYDVEASWKTYPERLQDAGVSWRIYQNEISLDTGLQGEEDAWLSSFTDNPLEWMSQYRVRFSRARRQRLGKLIASVERRLSEVDDLIAKAEPKDRSKLQSEKAEGVAYLAELNIERDAYSDQAWQALSERDRELHRKAFCDNSGDPDYRTLETHSYIDGETERSIFVPKGDVLYQFREDVKNGKLPAVSWLVAPERFSDHPGSAWFGAWYLSEAFNILTEDPEVWKKTVFVLCYDENDGYFDHVPPFVAPHPNRPETGKTSPEIDTSLDVSDAHGRDHSIGLGYRCPLVIASPWTRGGSVNSQVSDHTSIIMFLETWLKGKGKEVKDHNISPWRRTVCGDLTSAFKPYNGEKIDLPKPLERDAYIERIHKASFKKQPEPADTVSPDDIKDFQVSTFQEKGVRLASPLPYELEASITKDSSGARIIMEAGKKRFGARSAGAAFNAYSYSPKMVSRAYAVVSGGILDDLLPTGDKCSVRIDGPNGFMRELICEGSPRFEAKLRGRGDKLSLALKNLTDSDIIVLVKDESYGRAERQIVLGAGKSKSVELSAKESAFWYDWSASFLDATYRFAGKLETGAWTTSDPAMS